MLLGPIDPTSASALPEILCVVQVLEWVFIFLIPQIALEGEISQDSVQASIGRGIRASGDLIPWTLTPQVSDSVPRSYKQFLDQDFASLSGARIVRIATHPGLEAFFTIFSHLTDYQNMGYGRRAMEMLRSYYEGQIPRHAAHPSLGLLAHPPSQSCLLLPPPSRLPTMLTHAQLG